MSDLQNQFYSSISKYYSQIFPFNPGQLNFVKKKSGELNGKQILDIGCATGELAFRLATNGSKVVGIDLNEDLLLQAKANKKHPNLTVQKGNMLELENDFAAARFDSILCFGNTLVHLQSEKLVQQMLSGVYALLKPGGQFLLQILNYDYIVNERVSALPLIETPSIKFIRNYKFNNTIDLLGFQTNLEIKAEGKKVSNETPLLALKSKNLKLLLQSSGFTNIQLYANFKQDSFGGKHIPLVVSCAK